MSIKHPTAIVAYVIAVCLAAGAMLASAEFDVSTAGIPFWNTFVALLALGLLAEFFSLRLRVGTATSAVSFVAYLSAVLLLGPPWAMVIAGTTELVAETVVRRKPLIKILHNTAKEIVAVGFAGWVYVAAGGTLWIAEPAMKVPAFLGATVLYFLVSNGAAATAVAMSSRSELGEAWSQIVVKGLVHDVLSSSLAPLLAFLWIKLQLSGLLLVIVPLFFVRHALHVNLQLEQTNRELLELMVKSIEARDPYTSGHSVRVATFARAIARSLGLPARDIEQIETAALLHDVGKIYGEYAAILRKGDDLSPTERELIQTHPGRSAELVRTISSLRGYVERCVRCHHEHYDGGGYPDGLVGDEIPIGARIVMVADTADAMMTDRPYRGARTYEDVIREFDRYAGTQFDPDVVEAFKRSTAIRRLIEERQLFLARAADRVPERRVSLVGR
jgi:putative nucleotidyltransferase with HDIG domain